MKARFALGGDPNQPWLDLLPVPFPGFGARIFLKGILTAHPLEDGRAWSEALHRRLGPMWPQDFVVPYQVHGTALIEGRKIWELPARPKADGALLLPGDAGAALRFADCWPVVIASSSPRFVLALHSGYRGTLAGIGPRAAADLDARFGNDWRRDAWAWIGPGIGACCYLRRCGDETLGEARAKLPPECLRETEEGTWVDLGGAIERQLVAAGLSADRIARCGACTLCGSLPTPSYRRGDPERMILAVSASGGSTFRREEGEY
jgi:copper oxidase (laccase) domain-containing protein